MATIAPPTSPHMVNITALHYWAMMGMFFFWGIIFGVLMLPQLIDWFRCMKNNTYKEIVKHEKELRKKRKKVQESEEFKKRLAIAKKAIKNALDDGENSVSIFHIYDCPIDREIRARLESEHLSLRFTENNNLRIYWN